MTRRKDMTGIRRRGSRYQVRVDGFPAQTVATLEAARRVRDHLVDRKKTEPLGLWKAPPSLLGEELDRYVAAKSTAKPRTVEFLERTAKGWTTFRDRPLNRLSRADIEDHIDARKKTRPQSAKNELALLKAVLRAAEARGQEFDPRILGIPPVKHRPRVGEALTVDECDLIAAGMPESIRRIVPVALFTGMRQGELFALEDTHLQLDDARLVVVDSKTEAGRRRVALRPAVVTVLREQLLARANGTRLVFPREDGRMWDRHSFRQVWAPAVKDARLEHVTFHLLRHSAVSVYAQGGLRIEHVAAQLGWAPSSMAAMYGRYRHLFDGEVEARIAALDAQVLDESRTGVSG